MRIVAIAAVADNMVIGSGDDMVWHLSEDWRRFKRVTMGHAYVEGRRTFEQVGVLPGRRIIVVTRDPAWQAEGVHAVPSIEAALDLARSWHETHCYIGGGAQVYAASLDRCTELDLTLVHQSPEGAARFPDLDPARWRMVHTMPPASGDQRFEFSRWFPVTVAGPVRLVPPSLSDVDAAALLDLPSAIESWLLNGLGPWLIRGDDGTLLGVGGVHGPEAGDDGLARVWQLDLPKGLSEPARRLVTELALEAATSIGGARVLVLDRADETAALWARRAGFQPAGSTAGGLPEWRRAGLGDAPESNHSA